MPRVSVSGTGSEMQGVARLDDGRAVFIPFALPGEELEIGKDEIKERYATGHIERVIKPSPCRREPDCPYYEMCGGCRARHMTYEMSLKLKRDRVRDVLIRLGGQSEPNVLETLPSPQIDAYRNKAEFAVRGDKIGVYREGTRELIEIEACLLQSESVNRLLKLIKPLLIEAKLCGIVTRVNAAGEMMLTLCQSEGNRGISLIADEICALMPEIASVYACRMNIRPTHALDGKIELVRGKTRLNETLNGLSFTVSPQSFFQVNRLQAERLYNEALALADLRPTDEVCDIYCGAGTISLCAAKSCAGVTGIELIPSAISDAIENAKINGLSHKTRFICADAAKEYPRLSKTGRFDAVIADPPRKGLDKAVLEALINVPTNKLIYVSCDPATLARDIKALTQSTYTLISAQPVDMFPWTKHTETVALLMRGRS